MPSTDIAFGSRYWPGRRLTAHPLPHPGTRAFLDSQRLARCVKRRIRAPQRLIERRLARTRDLRPLDLQQQPGQRHCVFIKSGFGIRQGRRYGFSWLGV